MSNKQPTNIKTINLLRASDAAGNDLMGDGRKLIASQTSQSFGGGKLSWVASDRPNRSPEDVAKRVNFFAARIAARKDPANCGKCGKPSDIPNRRMCQRCTDTQRRRIAKNKGHGLVAGESYSVEKLAAMVLQMRREMDKMHTRFKLWQKAAKYRETLKYRTQAIKRKYFQNVTRDLAHDYLRTTNHAYETQED